MSEPDNARRTQGGRFQKGQSGNPAGMPKGTRHRATMAAETLLDGEAEALTRKAVELALAGDGTALRICLDRVLPPRRERPIRIALPPLKAPEDGAAAMAAITAAVSAGEITAGDGAEVAKLVELFVKAIEASDFDRRLRALEEAAEQARGR